MRKKIAVTTFAIAFLSYCLAPFLAVPTLAYFPNPLNNYQGDLGGEIPIYIYNTKRIKSAFLQVLSAGQIDLEEESASPLSTIPANNILGGKSSGKKNSFFMPRRPYVINLPTSLALKDPGSDNIKLKTSTTLDSNKMFEPIEIQQCYFPGKPEEIEIGSFFTKYLSTEYKGRIITAEPNVGLDGTNIDSASLNISVKF